jgi:hypothetical protein
LVSSVFTQMVHKSLSSMNNVPLFTILRSLMLLPIESTIRTC